MRTLKEQMDFVEDVIVKFAKRNTEGDYVMAKIIVRKGFKKIPLTDRQVTRIVNRVWDRVNITKEVVA